MCSKQSFNDPYPKPQLKKEKERHYHNMKERAERQQRARLGKSKVGVGGPTQAAGIQHRSRVGGGGSIDIDSDVMVDWREDDDMPAWEKLLQKEQSERDALQRGG